MAVTLSRMARYIAGCAGVLAVGGAVAKEPAQNCGTCVVDAGGLHGLDERPDARAPVLRSDLGTPSCPSGTVEQRRKAPLKTGAARKDDRGVSGS